MAEPDRVVGRPFQPGVSGNPYGRPLGSRNKLVEDFLRDATDAWRKHGADALDRMALTDPSGFVKAMASLVPKDVALTVSQRLPGGLEPDDWSVTLELLRAIKEALPGANDRQPGEVMQFVLQAIQAATAKTIDAE